MVNAITDQEFTEKTAEGVSLVDFWAPWCGPCRMQSPVIDALAEKMAGEASFYKMNVDEETEVAREFGIMSIPTLLIKKDGEVVDQLVGFHDEGRLEAAIRKHL